MPNSLCVLLDANAIIEAHARDVWASLLQRVTLVIPSIVLQESQFYIDPTTGQEVRIDLTEALQNGAIREVSATLEQLSRFYARFDRVFVQRMDPGEAEAIALLLDGALPEHQFCTGDGPAIRALSLLDMPDAGISLEA